MAWTILGTYLFHFNDNEYLIITDYYSKYLFVRKMLKPCTIHAVVAATKGLLSEQGVPEKIISDNGRHFDCVNYRSFAETWGFNHNKLSTLSAIKWIYREMHTDGEEHSD